MAATELQKHDAEGHGAVEAHHAAAPSYNPDAPSEEWGWHGQWRLFASRGSKILLGSFVIVTLLMLFGNHVSRVEDWYLVVTGVLMLLWLVWRERAARRQRRLRP